MISRRDDPAWQAGSNTENADPPRVDSAAQDEPNLADPPGPPAAAPEEEPLPLTGNELKGVIEALLFASGEAISRPRLRKLLKEAAPREIDDLLLQLEREYLAAGRAFGIVEDSSGIRLLTRSPYAAYVARLRGEKRGIRLSQAAFETLAVIAYRQPIRRADLESIRGVQCGPILKNLQEWNLIHVTGRDESLGRPLLYGTSGVFLEQFGLSALRELPEPDRLRALAGDHGVEIADDAEHLRPLFREEAATALESQSQASDPQSELPAGEAE